ncbi:hypothetical protein Kpol_1000p14 [Vanderwaltozyma polyspora DSM 70294]|uniref:non-specific serine/threonine protein kinase n=1 Tax=Vanderwaltozyma polyspora (strain ATCC 22028 / DSM 70294 / BCRC 21397 / CBS 2163 / NBRC 10782 / NRRL Y-8283 / UCD 57-17) TaxID=436907 RepID=A7TPV4_VANPO|nr:uncharacterized protein Kpol_1000p14 [Vanderwaltozyma polyspora DSM 70294]EDO15702.1 hypothetical protein Kpol_1000p14 [Vanderwaltozyma polyspora DSM 70294]
MKHSDNLRCSLLTSSFKTAIENEPLEDKPKNKEKRKLYDMSPELSPLQSTHNGSEESKTRRETKSPLTYPITSTTELSTSLPRGKLYVTIIQAINLPIADSPGSIYVVGTFENSETTIFNKNSEIHGDDEGLTKSKSHSWNMMNKFWKKSGKPESNSNTCDFNCTELPIMSKITWDKTVVFDVSEVNSELDISVYDASDKDKLLGFVKLLPDLYHSSSEIMSKWLRLKRHPEKGNTTDTNCQILIEWKYKNTDQRHYSPEDFNILRMLGKGTFGRVYQVEKKDTKTLYAMKVISKRNVIKRKEVKHTLNERNILVHNANKLCSFIVKLKFSFQTAEDLYLVTDFMSGGELFLHLQREGRFPEYRAKFYCAQLVMALEFLHDNDIIYRDLKPENILLDAKGNIALCDFGLSKLNLEGRTNTFCGTTEYLAPELLLDATGYTKMVDFWSLGVLMFEMCCGWSPFFAPTNQQMYQKIAYSKIKFPVNSLSKGCRLFIKGLMNRNPLHRLGAINDARELRAHEFFRDTDWEALMKKEVTPPFKPHLSSDRDTSYFDPAFTQTPTIDVIKEYNKVEDTAISPSWQQYFVGFTYNGESHLEANEKYVFDNNGCHPNFATDEALIESDSECNNEVDLENNDLYFQATSITSFINSSSCDVNSNTYQFKCENI